LKLMFLIVTRAVSLLGLSRREWWWKDAEILMLRHQLAVAERERPRAHSRLTWPDRAWLALLAGTVPAERLAAMRLIVTPGTILRWQRDIVRRRWARLSRRGRSGRPATDRKVRSVVLRLARENESWGYRRIHGELTGLGITVAPSTVWQILKSAGINRAPRRGGPSWAEFLRSQAQGILALDFFTADLLNGTKVYVLAVIEHGTRRIRILGATGHPVQSWVMHQARNLLMDLEDTGTRESSSCTTGTPASPPHSIRCSRAAGIRVIRTAVQALRMNAYAERWVRTVRAEVTDRMLIAGPRHLRAVLEEYVAHYHQHRPHRARNLQPPDHDHITTAPAPTWRRREYDVTRSSAGLIHEYERVA
jgi:transposase